MGYLNKNGFQVVWEQILNSLKDKVNAVDGKGLSTNDYTNEDKAKVAGLSAGGMATESYVDNAIAAIPQSDWDETDEANSAFIKNKPDENDAIELMMEMSFIDPVTDENGAIYTNENGEIFTL